MSKKQQTSSYWQRVNVWSGDHPVKAILTMLAVIIATPILVIYGNIYVRMGIDKIRVTHAYSQELPKFNGDVARKEQLLERVGLLGPKISSDETDVCYTGEVDHGFVADHWYQECYLQSLSVFSTTLSKGDAQQLVTKYLNSGNEGSPSQGVLSGDGCELGEDDGGTTIYYRDIADQDEQSNYCISDVGAPPTSLFGETASKDLQRAGATGDIKDLGVDRILILTTDNYFYSNVGCTPWLCSNPRVKPVTAHKSVEYVGS